MARSISSQKRQRQNVRRAERHKVRRTTHNTRVRRVRDALAAKDVDAAEKALREATKILDRNATRRTVHPKTAARRKSRLARQINALKAGAK